MRAGELNRRITLEAPDPQVASSGEETVQYVPVGQVWAKVEPARGGEGFSGIQRFAEVTHSFLLRYRSDVTPEWRVWYQGRSFDIVEVLEVGRRIGLKVLATARSE